MQKAHEAKAITASGKMSRKDFEEELAKLQVELVRLQNWVQARGARVIVIFEGRDTAGKSLGLDGLEDTKCESVPTTHPKERTE